MIGSQIEAFDYIPFVTGTTSQCSWSGCITPQVSIIVDMAQLALYSHPLDQFASGNSYASRDMQGKSTDHSSIRMYVHVWKT
jgi:hypothetical protein